jgi:murein DD-endopeptidase MepM/ murein hydrolase activator NlpD
MSDRRWSIVMTREGEATSRRFRFSARRFVASVFLAFLVLGAGAFWLGHRSGATVAGGRAAAFQASIDSLNEENAKVVALAARMEEIEASYERLRAVMGGDVAPSARDVLLPPVRRDRGGTDAGVRPARGRPTLWPLVESGFVTRSFGDTVPGEGAHPGLDIAVPVGSYVRAAGTGLVVEAREDRVYGRYVEVEHAEDFRSLYAHNSWLFVAAGDSVEAGDVIALSGNTGRSTAPHLHLEIAQGGTRVDPLPFVSERS